MRIALDARMMFRPQRRGISKSLIRLYRELRAIRPDWVITGYVRSEPKDDAHEKNAAALAEEIGVTRRVIEMPGDRYDLWQRYRLPLAAWTDGADLLHCPENHFPAWTPLPTVATIHDLIPLDMPYGRPTAEVQRFEQSVRGAVQRATVITTPSDYTRDRLISSCAADPESVVTIPWSSDDAITKHLENKAQNTLDPRDRFGLGKRFVLHFGSIEPRKNTRRVIEAWDAIPEAARKDGTLCVVGLDESAKRAFAEHVATRGVRGVSLNGYVSDDDAAALLCAADVLAYPSLSEGFGLPILDAFAAKTAVVTSTITSLPEVAGDAAMTIDPTDPIALGRALRTVYLDGHERATLVARGADRLKKYAWKDAAERFAAVLERAANLKTRDTAANRKRAA